LLVAATVMLAVVLGFAASAPAADGPETSEQRISRLIEQLGDDSYTVREEAQQDLVRMGFQAYEALEAATENEDLEIAARAKYLLRLIRVQWTQESDPQQVKDLLEDYEFQSGEERLDRIRRLGRLPRGQGIGPLCRLVRFEGSELLSKYAAMEILDRRPADRPGQQRWAKALDENLPGGVRAAAQWLACYRRLEKEPQAALAEWSRLAEKEQSLLNRTPATTTSDLVASLLYYLAEVQAAQGQEAQADETAAKARGLNPGANLASVFAHWETAVGLQRRGLFRWAEAEYRYVVESGVPEFQIRGRIMLSEMKQDQGEHLGAAGVLEEMFNTDSRKLDLLLNQIEQTAAQIRARMDYFYACHWQQQGDRQKQREYLDKAIASDPAELDTLIACYKLPDADAEYRKKTVELINKAAAAMRREIEQMPDEPSGYNQLAWLVGNTEGDVDEALRFAHKAIELSPESGAYYDTLAHVYFGRGDFQNAVKYQARAAELEPHSGMIARQLEVFRAKLEQGKGPSDRP
jgi:tetratricopeptide (TPR) repeat protein